jgi:hypothetical protein
VNAPALRLVDADEPARPRTRGDCVGGPRPCPWVSCRYHLAVDVKNGGRFVRENFPGRGVDELAETCALDVADRGGETLERIGELLGVTRQFIEQTEARALRVLARRLRPEDT